MRLYRRLQLLFGIVGPGVDPGHHHIAAVPAPIGPGNRAQFKPVRRNRFGARHMRSLAHVQKRTVAVKPQRLNPLFVKKLLRVLFLVRLPHLLQTRHGLRVGQILLFEDLVLMDDLPHPLLDFLEIRLGQRLAQNEIVIKSVVNRRTETQLAVGTDFQKRLGHHVSQAVTDTVQVVFHDGGVLHGISFSFCRDSAACSGFYRPVSGVAQRRRCLWTPP